MAATTLGFIPLQLIPTTCIGQYTFDKGFPTNGTYVVVKTPTVAQQLQLTKSFKEMQTGSKEINNNVSVNKPVLLRCKRRVDFTGLGCKLVDSHNPSVSRRNERERKRVKMVNMGFETLRQHVPTGRKNKKMSKVETLRSAVQYIKELQEMLESHETSVNDMLSNVDMDALEDKVAKMIRNSENDSNNNIDTDNSIIINNDLKLDDHNNARVNSDQMNVNSGLVNILQTTCNQRTPESSLRLTQSSHHLQEHFFPTYQNSNIVFSSQYENVSSCTSAIYSQSSPSGSLHSPTSSIVSDSSYDSIGHDDEDILSFSNWF